MLKLLNIELNFLNMQKTKLVKRNKVFHYLIIKERNRKNY